MNENDAFFVGIVRFVVVIGCLSAIWFVVVSLSSVWVCNSRIKELADRLNKLEDKVRRI
jgi:hypothetical protein